MFVLAVCAQLAVGATHVAAQDTTPRPVAIEYSDSYYKRVLVHRWASYTELPIFAGEWYLGQRLLSSTPQPDWVRPTHMMVAGALGALFAVNTVTGVWNL